MLKLDGLQYSYDEQLFDFSLEARAGEVLAIIGPSGAGKSTLLQLVGGFLPAVKGSIQVDGMDIAHLTAAQRPVSTIFQEHNLFPHLDVFSNVALGIHPGLKLDALQKQRVMESLERCYIAEYSKRLPGELSGGQRQRVSIARVLARRRPVLLLDEALTALGPALRQEILQLIGEVVATEAMTALMVSHYPEDARLVSRRLAFLDDGRIQEVVNTDQLSGDTLSPTMRAYLGKS
ncbi:MAG: thiamine transport system ATP-binding protein [Parasphingorhabdus sp.]|jgi:thiamine transport system ATP-binding protein